ncbi:hypothetical protein BZG36_03703 [Bifiguratus adelaidae]|uniref:4-hydroxy-4-methyl-2-oxoglutarate aldolase n=1 Tax=Bifiguratus adelaidae TaxID=1938954 RepID=A0A261XZD4_9FUNG|nr:hypothetical protein BZG36_03703 [Bifiguratus adelaidae]
MASLEQLAQYSTCDIADALQKLGVTPYGGYIPDIVMHSPEYCGGKTRIVGPAFTVEIVPKSDKISPTLSEPFVDLAPEESVIVIHAPEGCVKNAVWGGLMMARAKQRGAKGVIVDGRVRDILEQRADKFPVFCKGLSILGQASFTRPSAVNVPIKINGDFGMDITVHPGDIVVADVDGVVAVPPQLLDQVIRKCAVGVLEDGQCMEAIQQGMSVQEAFATFRGQHS